MVFAMKSSTTTLLLAVLLPFRTSVAVLPNILDVSSTPPQLTISKVQEAIQTAFMEDANLMVNPKLDSFLQYLVTTTTTAAASSTTTSTQADPTTDTPVNRNSGMDSLIDMNQRNEVVVDVLGQTSTTTTLKSVLLKNRYQVNNCYTNMCSLYLRADQIEGITKIPEVLKINLALSASNRKDDTVDRHGDVRRHARRDLQGSVTSQAVRAMFVDTARTRYNNLNGTGITIGILSDSFDCRGTQAQIDISSGDLPPLSRINVLADLNVNTSPSCICWRYMLS